MGPVKTITGLLHEWNEGDAPAFETLVEMVRDELTRMARAFLNKNHNAPIRTQTLFQEACISLMEKQGKIDWQDRKHFYCVIAQILRRILVDEARRHQASKRGGDRLLFSLDGLQITTHFKTDDILLMDQLMQRLTDKDEVAAQIVELRFYAGYSIDETADLMNLSTITVNRKWKIAKAYLNLSAKEEGLA